MNKLYVFTTMVNGKEVIVRLDEKVSTILVYSSLEGIEEDQMKKTLQNLSNEYGAIFELKEFTLSGSLDVITPMSKYN